MRSIIKQILIEETEDLDKRVFNFLRRHANIEERTIGDDEWSFTVKTVSFNIEGDWYVIKSFMSKKEMTNYLLKMLDENQVINLDEYVRNTKDLEKQKVVKTVRLFIDSIFKSPTEN
jgi:hypothetical protein